MAGYSGTPLWKKLGYKNGLKAYLDGPPNNYSELLALPPEVQVTWLAKKESKMPFVHLFASAARALRSKLDSYRKKIAADGVIWVSWPKKSALIIVFFLTETVPAARAGRLPGETITNSKGTTLQPSVSNQILALERQLAPWCKRPRIVQTTIDGEPRRLGLRMMQWSERWTIDRCGAKAVYFIHFDFRGSVGTFKVEPPKTQSRP
jgi:hypothetical protein